MTYLQMALKTLKPDQEQEEKTGHKIILIKKGMTEGRRKSLELVMDTVMNSARDGVVVLYDGQQFKSNDEIAQGESKIIELYKLVLHGEATLYDFHQSILAWEILCKDSLER